MKKINNKGITIVELIVTIALVSIIMVFLYSLLSNVTFESDSEFIDITDAQLRADIIRTVNDSINSYNLDRFTDETKEGNEKHFKCIGNDKVKNSISRYTRSYNSTLNRTTITFLDNNAPANEIFKLEINEDDGSSNHYSNIIFYSKLADATTAVENDCTRVGSFRAVQKWTYKKGWFDASKSDCKTIPDGKKLSDSDVSMIAVTCSIPVYTDNINNREVYIKKDDGTTKNFDNNNTLDDIVITFGATKSASIGGVRSYTLTFNNHGGSGLNSLVVYNNSTNSIAIPTYSGHTFKGYASQQTLTPAIYTHPYNNPTYRLETVTDTRWARNIIDDTGKFFQASLTLQDTGLTAPPIIEFNDVNLTLNKDYKVTPTGPNTWKYDVAFNVYADMVKEKSYSYENSFRFIDFEGVTSNVNVTINYMYIKDGIYFDETGAPLANRTLTENKTLHAMWE